MQPAYLPACHYISPLTRLHSFMSSSSLTCRRKKIKIERHAQKKWDTNHFHLITLTRILKRNMKKTKIKEKKSSPAVVATTTIHSFNFCGDLIN